MNETIEQPLENGSQPAMKAFPAPSLSVVYSFANEEDVLPASIDRTRRVLREQEALGHISRYELIFVNDASTDRSLDILLAAAEGNQDIRIINMSRNFGVSPCVLAGFDYSSGDLVVYLDVDLQDPPEVIPELLSVWRERGQPDVIHTVRRVRDGETRIKKMITWVGYRILKHVSSVQLRIEAGDFKMLSRRVVRELCQLREKKPYMRGLVAWVGFKQTEIYYDRQPRGAGSTKFPVLGSKVIRNFFDSALISFSDIPLQLATLMGMLISVIAFLLLIQTLVEKFRGNNIPGWSALMVTGLFMGGMQMLFLGVIGLYINAIFLESKGRPNYIIDNTFGFPEKSKSKFEPTAMHATAPAEASQHPPETG
jgi:dolichol-phosphate mannosyltransferase